MIIKHLSVSFILYALLNITNAYAMSDETNQCHESTQDTIKMMVVFNPNGETESWKSSGLGMRATGSLKELLPIIDARLPIVFKCNGIKARFPVADGAKNRLDFDDYVLSIKPLSAYYNSRVGSTITMNVELLSSVPRKMIWHSEYTFTGSLFGIFKSKEEKLNESVDKLLAFLLGSFRNERVYEPPNPLVDFYGEKLKFAVKYHDTGFAVLDDVNAVPYLLEKGRVEYGLYLTRKSPRAFAISSNGSFGWSSGYSDASDRALDNCNKKGEGECKLYSVDDAIVWNQPSAR